MKNSTQAIILFLAGASISLTWSSALLAAASGELGVSASVMERCRVDFSEGSADYFQACSSVEIKASGTAANVLGELSAVDPSSDPYFLDRNPNSMAIAAAEPNTPTGSAAPLATERRRRAPKVVTISY